MRLAHFVKHSRGAVLGSDLELTAHMIFNKLPYEIVILILEQIVISYARADKHFFDLRQISDLTQDVEIFAVVNGKIGAGLRCKAFFALAEASLLLPVAGRPPEIR